MSKEKAQRIESVLGDVLELTAPANVSAVECTFTISGSVVLNVADLSDCFREIFANNEKPDGYIRLRIDPVIDAIRITSPGTKGRIIPCKWISK
ncbi:hypothetical protein [Parasutterella secunda]|uniref:hypothetical protein n=1 Tax=Parasutterella secunda TaxID=626947 RepID=UPI0021ABB42D|nr:hypothetical protein [Parasutterella secunda]MCR8920984.1 hypothetical protein [Parasutterella secunda]